MATGSRQNCSDPKSITFQRRSGSKDAKRSSASELIHCALAVAKSSTSCCADASRRSSIHSICACKSKCATGRLRTHRVYLALELNTTKRMASLELKHKATCVNGGERERERQRDRETERQRDRETERQRDRETERQRDRDRETERQRQRDRETERQRERERESESRERARDSALHPQFDILSMSSRLVFLLIPPILPSFAALARVASRQEY